MGNRDYERLPVENRKDKDKVRRLVDRVIARDATVTQQREEIERLHSRLRELMDAVDLCERERHTAQMSGLETGWEHPSTPSAFARLVSRVATLRGEVVAIKRAPSGRVGDGRI